MAIHGIGKANHRTDRPPRRSQGETTAGGSWFAGDRDQLSLHPTAPYRPSRDPVRTRALPPFNGLGGADPPAHRRGESLASGLPNGLEVAELADAGGRQLAAVA